MATSYDCKFIETSVGINHNVDELLVGILTQIRLKLENPERARDLFRKRSCSRKKNRNKSPLGGSGSHKPYRGSRTSTSLKVKGLLGKVWARDSKSKSCENLHAQYWQTETKMVGWSGGRFKDSRHEKMEAEGSGWTGLDQDPKGGQG
ncbi:hypothetical protein ANN_24367 [Periplaneta americana]|uniref:Uncharacterized protein n=1 Tax=Periplaneta americana TaxID=6978 RepID=A0ABQ8S2X1_PERAM|nr:hypothetical protein ANN_24367 [Periplaneta americana]